MQKGWLTKKGKARWFIVVNEVLMWFKAEQVRGMRCFLLTMQNTDVAWHANGSLSLAGCNVTPGIGEKNTFMLSTEQGRTLVLTAKSAEETEEWLSFLRERVLAANAMKAAVEAHNREEGGMFLLLLAS